MSRKIFDMTERGYVASRKVHGRDKEIPSPSPLATLGMVTGPVDMNIYEAFNDVRMLSTRLQPEIFGCFFLRSVAMSM